MGKSPASWPRRSGLVMTSASFQFLNSPCRLWCWCLVGSGGWLGSLLSCSLWCMKLRCSRLKCDFGTASELSYFRQSPTNETHRCTAAGFSTASFWCLWPKSGSWTNLFEKWYLLTHYRFSWFTRWRRWLFRPSLPLYTVELGRFHEEMTVFRRLLPVLRWSTSCKRQRFGWCCFPAGLLCWIGVSLVGLYGLSG